MTSSIAIRMQQTRANKKLSRSQKLCTITTIVSTREAQIKKQFPTLENVSVTTVKSTPEAEINKWLQIGTNGLFDEAGQTSLNVKESSLLTPNTIRQSQIKTSLVQMSGRCKLCHTGFRKPLPPANRPFIFPPNAASAFSAVQSYPEPPLHK